MAKDSSMPTTRTTRAKTNGTRSLLDEKLLRIVCDRLPWNAALKDRANVWKSVDVALWQGELPQFNARSRFAELSDTYYHGAARTKVSPAVYTLLDSIATGNIVSCGDAQALAGKTRKSAAEVRDTEVKRQKLSKRGQKKDAPREEVVKAIKRKKDPEEEEEEEEVVEILVDEEETQEEGKCATDGEVKKDKLEPSRAVSSATDITREESGAVVSSALVPIATRPTFEVISQYLEGNRKERATAYETVDNLIAAQERDQTLAKKYLKFLE